MADALSFDDIKYRKKEGKIIARKATLSQKVKKSIFLLMFTLLGIIVLRTAIRVATRYLPPVQLALTHPAHARLGEISPDEGGSRAAPRANGLIRHGSAFQHMIDQYPLALDSSR